MSILAMRTIKRSVRCLHVPNAGVRFPCPGGRYGNKDLEVRNTCAGACEEGHWCGEASTSPAENKCGAVNLFCPYQSAAPQYVR